MQFNVNKKRLVRYAVVLATAIIARILFAILMPIEAQKYIGLIIIIMAIATFFIWDYAGRRKDQK